MNGKLQIYSGGTLIVESDGTMMPEINEGNTIDVSYSGETLTFDVSVNGNAENSSFVVSSDANWVKIMRMRNKVDIIVEPNYDIDARSCNLTFKHNVAVDVECFVLIEQEADEYSIEINEEEITLPLIGNGTRTVSVACTGGTKRFKLFKPKKYRHMVLDGGYSYDKRVAYDWGIKVKRSETENELIISSDGTLDSIYEGDDYVNNSFYIITVSHEDIIGVTDSVKVSFAGVMPEVGLDLADESSQDCPPVATISVNITNEDTEQIVPSVSLVDERDEEVEINSTGYSDVLVITEPVESLVYFNFYSDFIDDVKISHDGTYSTISIKAKPNPYSFERYGVGYIINAEYPHTKRKIYMVQRGNT